jgi:hypothetical protein
LSRRYLKKSCMILRQSCSSTPEKRASRCGARISSKF